MGRIYRQQRLPQPWWVIVSGSHPVLITGLLGSLFVILARNMKKIISVLSVLSMLAVASTAFAASISDARFSNNDTTVDAAGNATISGTYKLTVYANEAIESQRVAVNGLTADTSVGGSLGYQEGVYSNVPFSIKVPANTGTYNVDLSADGIYGANRAISPVDGNANSWAGPTTVGTVRVVADASNTSTSGGSTSSGVFGFATFADFIAAIKAALNLTGSTGTTKPACPPSGNTSLVQTWLLNNGYEAKFHAAGVYAATGFWGPITTSAYNDATAACK